MQLLLSSISLYFKQDNMKGESTALMIASTSPALLQSKHLVMEMDGVSYLISYHSRSMTYLLRSIDDSAVVAELQGADDGCSNAQHQVKCYLLQDKRT